MGMVSFREEQRFEWFWTVVWLIPVVIVGYGLYRQAVSAILLWPPLVVTAVVAVWMNQSKLITEVRTEGLWIHFVLLWPERTIPWSDIRSVEALTYRPIKDFGGWGVRWATARGIVYNARGKRGVRMVLASGERVLVGSQRADELARAIGERTVS
jgi:hypothetical protein